MANRQKVETVQVSGVLQRCDVVDDTTPDWNYTHRYSPNTEHRHKLLDCCLVGDDGNTYYFKTPPTKYRITCGGPAAVITFHDSIRTAEGQYVWPDNHPWFGMTGTQAVATPGKPADKTLVPLVKVGDRITIHGRVKDRKISKAGKPYTVLNHLIRVTG